ncbi:Rossmann-fold NAD(P)-binding domain-containing protein [Streptomyces lavendulae]|uniref:hypothetical protein n=1 Tax=Streptomyces lavendulae TaxID=1914 RepID=UPI0024A3D1D8|nr:short-chain dehydrogenase [Streptomyces roseochromogenus]
MDVTESAVASPVLVVGGTGMLAAVVGALVREGLTTVVVSRNPPAPAAFGTPGTAGGVLIPVSADYTEPERFARTLRRAAARTGPFRQAVLWVHAEGRPHAYAAVADTLTQDASVIEVVGSGALAPTAPAPRPPEAFGPHIRHRTVVLGFTGDGPHTRWLDHGEIGTGVLAALRAPEGDRLRVVGRVRPWEDRPSA